MAMDDLFQALQMFKGGMQELQVSRALSGANEAVNEIKGSALKEEEQRAALHNVSTQLVSQLGGLGAPIGMIQQQANAISERYANPMEAALAGATRGDKSLVGNAMTADVAGKAGDKYMQDDQQVWQSGENALDRDTKSKLLSQKQEKLRPLSAGETDKLSAQEDLFTTADEILSRVKANPQLVGMLAGRIPARGKFEGEFGALQADLGRFFDKYRVSVTGAGASPGEINMLLKRIANEKDFLPVFEKKMQSYLTEANRSRKIYLDNLKRSKRDVDMFEPDLIQGRFGASNSAPLVKTLKDGRKVEVQPLPDGKFKVLREIK